MLYTFLSHHMATEQPTNGHKTRLHVCFDRNVVEKAEELKVLEQRTSVSNLLAALVIREWEKRHAKAKPEMEAV